MLHVKKHKVNVSERITAPRNTEARQGTSAGERPQLVVAVGPSLNTETVLDNNFKILQILESQEGNAFGISPIADIPTAQNSELRNEGWGSLRLLRWCDACHSGSTVADTDIVGHTCK